MRVIDPGSTYELANLKGDGTSLFRFYKDPEIHGSGHAGPSTQEVMRVVIDRIKTLESEKPHWVNEMLIQRGREMIALFEVRALVEKVVKGRLDIESLPVGADGHIILEGADTLRACTCQRYPTHCANDCPIHGEE